MKPLRLAALACATLVPLAAACGSDGPSSSEATLPGGVTVPDGVTIPDVTMPGDADGDGDNPIASAECQQVFLNFGTASSSAGASISDFDELGEQLDKMLPDDLKDDGEIYIEIYREIGDAVKETGGKFDDPKVMDRITELTKSPEYQKAAQELGMWFASGCPAG